MESVKGGLLRQAWRRAWPYWASVERRSAGLLLGSVVALNLVTVWLTVRLNAWNADFYNALQEYDWPKFWWQFGIFGLIALGLIIVAVYQFYLRQILHIRWRRWLTSRDLDGWLGEQTYYRLQLDRTVTDNPDQRIADDLDRFATISLTLSLGLLNATVTLVSFLFILWNLSGALSIPLGGGSHLDIPGYMVFAALIYAVVGTWVTQRIGGPLAGLLFDQQRYEADFRFSLVRLRENAESVAFYRGERHEIGVFHERFANIVANWWRIIRRRVQLTWFTSGYQQMALVFPFLVAAPRYFAKEIQLGGLMQVASAFGQVQDSLSFIVASYTEIAEYKAVVQRLSGFRDKLDGVAAARAAPQSIAVERGVAGVEVEDLDLALPGGRALSEGIALSAHPERSVLVNGPSGSGKSTLLRAIAGLWPYGRGRIRVGAGDALFLPQRPYLPLGTLADALAYPGATAALGRPELEAALHAVGLGYLRERLDDEDNWAQRLSGGEQQRLGFARILLTRPSVVFLDEATSALDETAETALYRLLRAAEWRPTIVSVGHRGSLRQFHAAIVDLGRRPISMAAES